uniref:nucleoid-associated protein n=1 Tax=uncultured Dysgonomonas sp. TaxID=206096 RepID=UPI00260AA1D1|nr:nucleoid-associated protein [uncultured Dysgonomonas sp.]
MKRESVLTDSDKDSIEIVKFIFHIIIEKEQKPIYLKEVNLNAEQIDFFKNRLIAVAQGIRYIFPDKPNSATYNYCKNIVDDNSTFLKLSKKITASFKEHHKGNTADGVFIVSLVKIKNSPSFIFLLKIDNRLVYQYKINNDRATLNKIRDTFVEDAKAIQKMALISLSDEYVWEALAFDRNGGDSIKKYFRDFLGVVEKDDIFELTKKSLGAAARWANQNKELLNNTDVASNYRQRAINYLTSHTVFDSDQFINTVIYDEDLERKNRAMTSFKKFLDELGIYGQIYKISQKALTKNTVKHTTKTAEGLTLTWTGDPARVNLTLPKERGDDGMYHILITTNTIEEQSV